MEIHQSKLCQEREELMIFRAWRADRRTAEDWIIAEPDSSGHKKIRTRVGIRLSGVIEVRTPRGGVALRGVQKAYV